MLSTVLKNHVKEIECLSCCFSLDTLLSSVATERFAESHVKIISKMCLELSRVKKGFISFMPQLTSLAFAVRSQRLVGLE